MGAFQAVIGRYGSALVRAKGFVTFAERPTDRMLFQLVGQRATIGRAPVGAGRGAPTQLVFIARRGTLDETSLVESLECCRGDRMVMKPAQRGATGDG
jgi:G3E family GTPase